MGVLYKQFALTIAVSVAISAFVALSLTPALCATMLYVEEKKVKIIFFFARFNDMFDRMLERYEQGVKRLIEASRMMLMSLLAITGLAVFFFFANAYGICASGRQRLFHRDGQLAGRGNGKENGCCGSAFCPLYWRTAGVETTMGVTGFDILSGGPKQNSAMVFVKLHHWDQRTNSDLHVRAIMRKAFAFGMQTPEARILALNPPPIPGLGQPADSRCILKIKLVTAMIRCSR